MTQNQQQILGDTMTFLISILIRHPEIATLNFDPQKRQIQFTYIIKGAYLKQKEEELSQKLRKAIRIYHTMEKNSAFSYLDIYWKNVLQFSYLIVVRDLTEFTLNELNFMNCLIKGYIPELLPADSNEKWEESSYLQEEIIGYALDDMKAENFDKKVIAFREEGRVMVFSK